MKNQLTFLLLMISVVSLAQTSKQTQYAAYLKASKTLWEKSIEQAKEESGEESFETAIAMYGILGNTMATEDEDTFDEYKDQTIDLLKKINESNPEWGEPRAVLSSVYGLVMAYSPWKGMYLGMKRSSLMDEALRLQPESPLVQKLYGESKLYTPEMFGGDASEAIDAFQKSLELYEEGDVEEDWIYLDTMMGLAMAYRKMEEDEKAIATLKEAIEKEPQYFWAKSVLEKIDKS